MKIIYNPENSKSRWLGYFDLLGTKDLLVSNEIYKVFSSYQNALEKLDNWQSNHSCISYAWFSDTFIIYTENDSEEEFTKIEMVCRWFSFSLINNEIPLRGSLSCGDFYSDHDNGIFLGPALVEAHEYGEDQKWLGFILSPSTVKKLSEYSVSVEQLLNYRRYQIPFKKHVNGGPECRACVLGNLAQFAGGDNPFLRKLERMLEMQSDPAVISKYENTLDFMRKYRLVPSVGS